MLEFPRGKVDKQVTEKTTEKTNRNQLKEIFVQGQPELYREEPHDEGRVVMDSDTEVECSSNPILGVKYVDHYKTNLHL
jgi:hypothetical protein